MGTVISHQDLKQVLATIFHDKSVMNSEFVPKTDVLDSNDTFKLAYSVNLPAFFPTVFLLLCFYVLKKIDFFV